MSKTISQIAKEIGVARQSVWHKTKTDELKKHIQTVGNKIYIDIEGEIIIKKAFKNLIFDRQQNAKYKKDDKTTKPNDNTKKIIKNDDFDSNYSNKKVIDILNEHIAALHKQNETLRQDNKKLLDELQEERKHLCEIADKLAELANNAQKLHASDIVVRPKLEVPNETNTPTKKNNIFSLLFKRKTKQDET